MASLRCKCGAAWRVSAVALVVLSILKATSAVEEHRQAFIQTDSQLRHLVDGISLHMHQGLVAAAADAVYAGRSLSSSNDETAGGGVGGYSSPIAFYPSELDFKEHPVGIPDVATVIVSNPSLHTSVYLLSISGSTVHFHCSFFQDKVIAPGGNTTFSVVFLSRHEGHVHNTLYVHTSSGSYKYHVHGIGTPNPYRLRPFLGARVPLNSVYSSLIDMYNPHGSALQVTEMYSSGGDLHLELPGGERLADRDAWEIPPYGTKSVMKANFLARIEDNHTLYIRIKTNSSSEDYLVLPVEVEVSSAPGIYATTDVLDFGVAYFKDPPRTLALHVLNRGPKPVLVTAVGANPSNAALDVHFRPLRIPPDTPQPIQVATVTLNPARAATDQARHSGRVVVRSKSGSLKLTVPYVATVLHGSLEYNTSDTEFYVGDVGATATEWWRHRNLSLTNTFDVSVAIHRLDLAPDARRFFQVELASPSLVLHARETKVVGHVRLVHGGSSCVQFQSSLRVLTNVSHFDAAVSCYSGKVALHLPQGHGTRLDLGTLSVAERRDVLFAVANDNPVNVELRRFGSTVPHSVVEFLGVAPGDAAQMLAQPDPAATKKLVVPVSQVALFRVGVAAPGHEGKFDGHVFVHTQFEHLKVPLTFEAAEGSLSVVHSGLVFESTFPGKVSSVALYLQSSFARPMALTSVATSDSRFTFAPPPPADFLPVLQPNARTLVGTVSFDLSGECGRHCYAGFDSSSPGGAAWASSFSLPPDVALVDVELYELLRARWANATESTRGRVNVTLRIDTSEVRGFHVGGVALLSWPSLARQRKLAFPLTQIGNASVRSVVLENPSGVPVVAQVVPLHAYPNPEALADVVEHGWTWPLTGSTSRGVFRLLGAGAGDDTVAVRLAPGANVRLDVQFTPDGAEHSSVVLVRNNLTVLEALLLRGSGARAQLRLGNRAPGSLAPLQFDLTEKHLRHCGAPAVRRAFTLRNTGPLPVYVGGFDVSGAPCQGFGFRVLDCHAFLLRPNASRKVDIAFTPDFTLSRVQRHLNVRSSVGGATLDFSLVATLPSHLLPHCAAALPRPPWELPLYYVALLSMACLLAGVTGAAYLEAERVYRSAFVPMTLATVPVGQAASGLAKVFDLRKISAPSGGAATRRDSKVAPPASCEATARLSKGPEPAGGRKKMAAAANRKLPKPPAVPPSSKRLATCDRRLHSMSLTEVPPKATARRRHSSDALQPAKGKVAPRATAEVSATWKVPGGRATSVQSTELPPPDKPKSTPPAPSKPEPDDDHGPCRSRNRSKRLDNLMHSLELPYRPKAAKTTDARMEPACQAKVKPLATKALPVTREVVPCPQAPAPAPPPPPPLPAWDEPTCKADAYGEIARQTESFALRHSRLMKVRGGVAPSTSKPMASRVGIAPLASNDGVQCGATKAKVTPVGKIAPLDLGPVGKRPTYLAPPPPPPKSCWKTPAAVAPPASPPPDHGNLFLSSLLDGAPNRLGTTVGDSFLGGYASGGAALAGTSLEGPWTTTTTPPDPYRRLGNNAWLDLGVDSVWDVDSSLMRDYHHQEVVASSPPSDPWAAPTWPPSYPWSQAHHNKAVASQCLTTPAISYETMLQQRHRAAFDESLNPLKEVTHRSSSLGSSDSFPSLQSIWTSPPPATASNNWVNSLFGMSPDKMD